MAVHQTLSLCESRVWPRETIVSLCQWPSSFLALEIWNAQVCHNISSLHPLVLTDAVAAFDLTLMGFIQFFLKKLVANKNAPACV